MSGELWTIVALLLGAGGIVLGSLRREWQRADRSDDAYVRARNDAAAEYRAEFDRLRLEFQTELARRDREHAADVKALEEHVARLHRALAKLVKLVAPEHVAEATAVLIELGMPVAPRTEREEDPDE